MLMHACNFHRKSTLPFAGHEPVNTSDLHYHFVVVARSGSELRATLGKGDITLDGFK
jgi:hypothetical protein